MQSITKLWGTYSNILNLEIDNIGTIKVPCTHIIRRVFFPNHRNGFLMTIEYLLSEKLFNIDSTPKVNKIALMKNIK